MIALSLFAVVAVVSPQEPGFAPSAAEWSARDLEGRWALLESETLLHGWRNVESLVAFLEERREAELLERLCLYPRAEGQFATFEAALARLDAPQWARAVEWNLRQHDSHKRDEAHAAFYERRPALARDWLERNEAQLAPLASEVLKRLRASETPRSSAEYLLPPWSIAQVLAPLTSEVPVLDFGARQRATPGELYLHNVEAALRAVAQKQLYEEPWRSAVIELTDHARPEVRSFAWIALGEAARLALPISALDDAAFLAALDDPREDPRVRIAATMALAQRAEWSPLAWGELHRIAGDVAHPAWAAAAHALREVGDEMTIEMLEELLPSLRDDTRVRLALGSIETLRVRGAIAAGAPALALERTAFAELADTLLFARRASWTRRHFARATAVPELRQTLSELSAGYSAPADVRAVVECAAPGVDIDACLRRWAGQLSSPK